MKTKQLFIRCCLFLAAFFMLNQASAQDCSDCSLTVTTPQVTKITDCRLGFQVGGGINAQNCTTVDYTWDFGDGTIVTGASSAISHEYTSSGPFTVCVTKNATVNATGQPCSVTQCILVEAEACVDPCEDCALTVSTPSVTDITKCRKGFSVGGSINAQNCTTVDYTWDFGDGTVVTGAGSIIAHEYSGAGIYNVCVTKNAIINATGEPCSVTECVTVDASNCVDECEVCALTVTPPSVAHITDCRKGFSVGGSINAQNCTTVDYTWDFGDGTVVTGAGSITAHEYSTSGLFTVCVTKNAIINATGEPCSVTECIQVNVTECIDECEQCALSVTTPSVTDITKCRKGFGVGGSINAQNCTTIDYTWDFGDGTVVTGAGSVIAHEYTSPGIYTVCVTKNAIVNATGELCSVTECVQVDAQNCVDECEACALTVTPPTVANITDCRKGFSVGGSINAQNCTTVDYTWDFGDGTVQTGAGSITAHDYTSSGTFTVCVTKNAIVNATGEPCSVTECIQVVVTGCEDNCARCDLTVGIPNTFNISDCRKGFTTGGSINATNCSTVDYTWDFGDGTIVTGASNIILHEYTNDGTYQVCVTKNAIVNATGQSCQVTACTTIVVSGCGPMKANMDVESGELTAYPNPVNSGSFLKIQVSGDINTLQLIDLTGRVVVNKEVQGKGEQKMLIPSGLTEGIYFLRSANGNLDPIRIMIGNN